MRRFESCLPSQESSSNRCVFVVSSHVGKVLKLPCVSYPASASVLTGDAKPLGVGCERPPGLSRPFSSRGLSSVPAGIYGWSPAVFGYDTLTSGQDERRPSRRRGAAQCPSDPVCGQEETLRSSMGWIYRLSRLKRARVIKRFDKTQRT